MVISAVADLDRSAAEVTVSAIGDELGTDTGAIYRPAASTVPQGSVEHEAPLTLQTKLVEAPRGSTSAASCKLPLVATLAREGATPMRATAGDALSFAAIAGTGAPGLLLPPPHAVTAASAAVVMSPRKESRFTGSLFASQCGTSMNRRRNVAGMIPDR